MRNQSARARLQKVIHLWTSRLQPFISTHAPFLIVLAVGFMVRANLFLTYRPVAGEFSDSITYLSTSNSHLFGDASRMAGYPSFLRLVRDVFPQLSFVIGLQHVLGLATGVLLYALVRRVTDARWLSVVPAAFFLLSGDYLLLEHSLLTETLYIFLVTAGLTGLVFASTSSRPPVSWLTPPAHRRQRGFSRRRLGGSHHGSVGARIRRSLGGGCLRDCTARSVEGHSGVRRSGRRDRGYLHSASGGADGLLGRAAWRRLGALHTSCADCGLS